MIVPEELLFGAYFCWLSSTFFLQNAIFGRK